MEVESDPSFSVNRGRRAAVRRRGVDASPQSVEVHGSEEAEPLLDQLTRDVVDSQWVVVIDGDVDDVTQAIADDIYHRRRRAQSVVVIGASDGEGARRLNGYDVLALDAHNDRDRRFAQSLVADVVVVPPEGESEQVERTRRWQKHARYVLQIAPPANRES